MSFGEVFWPSLAASAAWFLIMCVLFAVLIPSPEEDNE